MDDQYFSSSELGVGNLETFEKNLTSTWQSLLPIVGSLSPTQAMLGKCPWNLSPDTLVHRSFLGMGGIVLLAGIVHALGSLVSEDNDMLIYLGSLIVVALYLGRVPALMASVVCLLFLSAGKAHSGFAITLSHSQYLLSFSLFIFTAYQVSKLADQVRREAWKSKQNARVLSCLHEFNQLSSRETSVTQLGVMLKDFVRNRLGLGDRVLCGASIEKTETFGPLEEIELAQGEVLKVNLGGVDEREKAFWECFFQHLLAAYQFSVERIVQTETYRRASVLEATQKLQSTLINSMSHDLQTPLSSILGTFEVLRDPKVKLPAEQQKELLEIGYTQTNRLLHLARNILNLSKIEGGGLRPALRWVNLEEVLQSALDRIEQRHFHRLSIKKKTADSRVWGDSTLLSQVIFNLLDNALKFSPPDSEVEVDISRDETNLKLAVKDFGFGIKAEEQALIFQRFYRADTPKKVPGSGLGLNICKGVVELHQGKLTVDSEPGRGSRFEMSLPLPLEMELAS